jgi:hypothetical protein
MIANSSTVSGSALVYLPDSTKTNPLISRPGLAVLPALNLLPETVITDGQSQSAYPPSHNLSGLTTDIGSTIVSGIPKNGGTILVGDGHSNIDLDGVLGLTYVALG